MVKKLTDPATGQLLSVMKNEIGVLHVTGVEGTYMPIAAIPPQRGDSD